MRATEPLAGSAYMGGQSENPEGHEEQVGSTHSSSGWTSKGIPERQGPLASLKQVGGEDHRTGRSALSPPALRPRHIIPECPSEKCNDEARRGRTAA